MIQVTIKRTDENSIRAFTVTGHANYNPGNDIVCAAVSAVTIGTVNSLDTLAQVRLPSIDYRSGLLKASIEASAEQHERAQTILESMLIMLQSIAQSYPEHLKIIDRRMEAN